MQVALLLCSFDPGDLTVLKCLWKIELLYAATGRSLKMNHKANLEDFKAKPPLSAHNYSPIEKQSLASLRVLMETKHLMEATKLPCKLSFPN